MKLGRHPLHPAHIAQRSVGRGKRVRNEEETHGESDTGGAAAALVTRVGRWTPEPPGSPIQHPLLGEFFDAFENGHYVSLRALN
jgi:hypothetical protein